MSDSVLVLDLFVEEPVLGEQRPVRETGIVFGSPVLVPADLGEVDPVHGRRTDLDEVRLFRLHFRFDLEPPRRNRRYDAARVEFVFPDDRVVARRAELPGLDGETGTIRGIGRGTVAVDLGAGDPQAGLRPRNHAVDIVVEAPAGAAEIRVELSAEVTVARLLGPIPVRTAAARQPTHLVLSTGPARSGGNGTMSSVDVLIIAALPLEFEAARAAADTSWRERKLDDRTPYLVGELATPQGGRLSVALARPTEMGPRRTGTLATKLAEHLRPACLAMSGVCAGNPDDTAPGDVVVAAPAYQYDEGKLTDEEFLGAHQQYPLSDPWLRAAQDFTPAGLPSHGDATEDEAVIWLLERLHLGQDARAHPARERYFPRGTWSPRLSRMESDGLIAWTGDGWALTGDGEARIKRVLADDVDGPDRLPFAVLAGPMAGGSAVVQQEGIWARLKRMGVRRILALEMEAATIATVAADTAVPHWLVAKGVMDHADRRKDDRFKRFAATASAEVLFALLGTLLPGRPSRAAPRAPRLSPGP